jgi:hypothetical protein
MNLSIIVSENTIGTFSLAVGANDYYRLYFDCGRFSLFTVSIWEVG